MANLKNDLRKTEKTQAIVTLIGGIAGFAFGSYISYLEQQKCIDKKQKFILLGLSIASLLASGASERLYERCKLTKTIDSLDKTN